MDKQDDHRLVFEVRQAWRLPDLSPIVPAGGQVLDTSEQDTSTFFDTRDGRLRGLGVTLERRHHADGTSWLLVLPEHGAQVVLPGRAANGTVPPSVTRQLAGVLTGADLVEVASVTTSRQTHRVLAGDGGTVVEVADSQVSGATLGATATVAQWREVALRGGSAARHDELVGLRRLVKRTGGARRAEPGSPLVRLLRQPQRLSHDSRLTRQVGDYLSAQCTEILVCDVALRNHNDTASVHRMRVAIRRLRSVLKGCAALLLLDATDLADDLRWTALQLGAIRDLDVLDARVGAALDALADEDVVGPVRRHLTETLATRRAQAYQSWQQAWPDPRYERVMSAIARWHLAPPVDPEAKGSAKRTLRHAARRVDRRLARAHGDPERLHDARKAAKQVRYVAEVLTPISGSATRRVKDRAKKLQTRLGEHQDAVVAAALLAEQGRAAGARADDNGYTYGLLVAEQRRLAARALKGLPKRL